MTFLISPDKFKGSLSALNVCKAIEQGLYEFEPDLKVISHPLADGGEGSLAVLENYLQGEKITVEVSNPLGSKIDADYLLENKNAYIELASASGLVLLEKQKQNPLYTSTYGAGEIVLDAINKGAENIFLFVGGSSTNDAGMGILTALGFKFKDKNGRELYPSGQNLIKVKSIDDYSLKYNPDKVSFFVLCDVDNKLTGQEGAAYVYAGQKGASESEIRLLDKGLVNFAKIVRDKTGMDITVIEGGGAAGGVAAGMCGLAKAVIKSGIDFIIDITGFEQNLTKADYVITGEGKLDKQSLQGKVVGRVADLTAGYGKPLILFVGKNELSGHCLDKLNPLYIDTIISRSAGIDDAMKNGAKYLKEMAVSMMSFLEDTKNQF